LKVDPRVLIIGGGIAGSVCARALEKLGIEDIHLIERAKDIGAGHSSKIDFAEDKGLKELMEKYDLPILNETNTSRWYSPSGEMFELKSKISDIWFKRGVEKGGTGPFEREVLDKTDVEVNTRTRAVKIRKGSVLAVDEESDEEVKYSPDIVVDATGNFSPYLNEDKKRNMVRRIPAGGFILDEIDIEPDIPHVFFDKKMFGDSYLLIFEGSANQISCMAYGIGEKGYLDFDELKNELPTDAISDSSVKGEISGSLYVSQRCSLARENVLFVGDAANLMDPLLSYGVENAVKSGIFAAEAIAEGDRVDKIKRRYEYSVKKELYPELRRKLKLRNVFNDLDNNDVNCLIRTLKELNKEDDIEELLERWDKMAMRGFPQILKRPRLLKMISRFMGEMI